MTKKRSHRTRKGDSSPFYKTLLPDVSIYTDGSASHTSRYGGWSFIAIFDDGFEVIRYGSEVDTTNNAMELRAAIEGMSYFRSPKKIKLVSDSAYLINTLEQKWWKDWEKRGFIGRNGKPTPNKELWIQLIELSKYHTIIPTKIKGHSGDINNERCDKLAKRARKAAQLGIDPEEKTVNRISKRRSRVYTLKEKESV